MKIAIMQPYLFPYLGYFQLVRAVDRFVIYDDVNFIKGGWINRNFILGREGPQRITLQLHGASPNRLINEVQVGVNSRKLLMTISQRYGGAPYFEGVFPLIESCLLFAEKNLARFLEHALRQICAHLGMQTAILVSSQIEKETALRGPDKVIAICKQLEADVYINAIGGQALYEKKRFLDAGLQLYFLQMRPISYPQFGGDFVPNLSIIDLMMFNSRPQLSKLLGEFALV
jgi:hypothetical protein